MRGLLLLLLVLAGVWLWRARASSLGRQPSPPPVTPPPLDTVACNQCSVHVPRAEAVQGRHGLYCCLEHLHQSER